MISSVMLFIMQLACGLCRSEGGGTHTMNRKGEGIVMEALTCKTKNAID